MITNIQKLLAGKVLVFQPKQNDKTLEKIPMVGFVSCKRCFNTYKYIDSSTANLYSHSCLRNQSPDQSSITSFIQSPRL